MDLLLRFYYEGWSLRAQASCCHRDGVNFFQDENKGMGGDDARGLAQKIPRDGGEVFTHFVDFCVETMAGKSILQECVSEEIIFYFFYFINFIFILNISPADNV